MATKSEEIRPEDSISHVASHRSMTSHASRGSVRSSVIMLKLEEKQKIAELTTRNEALREKHRLEKCKKEVELKKQQIENELLFNQLEITQAEEELTFQTEMAVCRAKVEVMNQPEFIEECAETGDELANEHSEQLDKTIPYSWPNPHSTPFQPGPAADASHELLTAVPDHTDIPVEPQRLRIIQPQPAYMKPPQDIDTSLTRLADLLANKRDYLPKMEPDVFSGSLLQFPVWIKSFEAIIESHTQSSSQRLYFLSKYTTGDARESIQGFLCLDNDDAYKDAKNILSRRYGDKYKISEAFRKKIDNWPVVKPGDGNSLQKLADLLEHCKSAMSSITYLKCLDDAEENKKILRKIPRYIADRWNRTVDKWLYNTDDYMNRNTEATQGQYPPFSVFCEFIKNEARVACGPGNVRSYEVKNDNFRFKPKERPNARTFASHTNMSGTEKSAISSKPWTRETRPPNCTKCKGSHTLETCKDFLEMSPNDKKSFASHNGLCFGCLRRGHLYRECKNRKHSHLFRDHPAPNDATRDRHDQANGQVHCETKPDNAVTHRISTEKSHRECHHSMIVPVIVHHRENPEQQFETYALLDNQSNACFISEATLQKLSVQTDSVNLKLTTMLKEEVIGCELVSGLVVRGRHENTDVELPSTYSRGIIPTERSLIPRPETLKQWTHLSKVAKHLHPYQENMEIGLLIGFNCSHAMVPREVITRGDNDPYAVRTTLGWGVVGNVIPSDGGQDSDTTCCRTVIPNSNHRHEVSHFTYRTQAKEVNPTQIKDMLDLEFHEKHSNEKISVEDRRFLTMTKEGIYRDNEGHFVLPLPFKKNNVQLPNNKGLALKRLEGLRNKLKRDHQYRTDYLTFMNDLLDKGYAEQVPENERSADNVWYIPHHGVYNKNKPGKIRVVFDCSAEYQGAVLNRELLQGPDLINSLVGVLCRFRQERIAFVCDIEGMFHQVRVVPEDRNYLRFLWFKDGDLENRPTEYRMTVHLFGATSSPGCANYALKFTADTFEKEFGKEAADFVRKNFYVDDGLKSVATPAEALKLISTSHELCKRGGFNLLKYACNDKEVLKAIPLEQRAKDVQSLDLLHDNLPISKTLGVQWCIESDTFQFRIELKDGPLTRRGILSTVSSIFDPLGLVAPFLLQGKKILQEICRDGCSWDDPIPENIESRWRKWRHELYGLSELQIPRCYKPKDFGFVQEVELHHFADASQEGYGECSYLRMIDENKNVSSSLVMAKSRVAPSKPVTIPRLELTAAVVAVHVGAFLEKELDYDSIKHFYWTDSRVVLGYIGNEARRFHIYVANRVQQIRNYTSSDQWNYVETKSNPADLTSRGMSANDIVKDKRWWKGPDFLSSINPLPLTAIDTTLPADDPEIKKVQSYATSTATTEKQFCDILTRLEYFSSWYRAKRAIALCLRFKKKLQDRQLKQHNVRTDLSTSNPKSKQKHEPVTVEEMRSAESVILQLVQVKSFPQEIKTLQHARDPSSEDDSGSHHRKPSLQRSSCLYRIDPFIDDDDLIHVGGRIRRANIPRELAHPVILPRRNHITNLIIDHHHIHAAHSGRNTTLNEIRAAGYWIIKARTEVTRHIWRCVICRKIRGTTVGQKMADLPQDRIEPAPPFTYSGVDYFGPFYVKEGRSEKKRWGVMFTCLVTRAVHIEVAHALTTDSFINAYRRFVGRRGPIRQLRSDRGTNFVGAKAEMESLLAEMNQDHINKELLHDGCDWIQFKMNVPHASHMGGVWERMVRSARTVLSALLVKSGNQLDDELLHTLMVEAETIVNSRPLTYPDMESPDSAEPLTPNQILTLKSKVVFPPPGSFVKEDLYCRKRWRRVQFLANEFWRRWRNEFLPTLQERRKWVHPHKNLNVGDIVLVLDDNIPRCKWPRAQVTQTFSDDDNYVRKVTVKTTTSTLDRPVHKLILLYRPETPDMGANET